MNKSDAIFFELLQASVGNRDRLSFAISPEEWEEVYDTVKKQAVIGITIAGLEVLPPEQRPPLRRIRQWGVKAEHLREKNEKMDAQCRLLCKKFMDDGMDSLILKGQGNMIYYPSGLQRLRVCGDIDIWVWPKEGSKGAKHPVRHVIEYCTGLRRGEFVYYHNLDWPVLRDTTVEVHYRPTWLFCPWRDRRLQRWLKEHRQMVEYNGYFIPTIKFNAVFQLLHLYKHIFEEGIGLRQLIDYYFLLSKLSDDERSEVFTVFKKIGVIDFAGGVMYLLQRVLAMPDDYLLCPANEDTGKELLDDVMAGGNFGHYNKDLRWELTPDADLLTRTRYAWQKLKRNFRFLHHYTLEVLWEPPFRIMHWAWRTFRLWRV